ncbi:AbrB/MazE/SpoVT family DNA-binding domain-containing protein [Planococcus salinus]|uniref:AbrB/MazE/SpoVT family DNA-binding domain-containing protein n=1 Tax=Planococcus salinus TaxID=1848460 RepID=A0A3M8P7A3_9BACL|nr:AbrB/MazE/SpoVT family DNA-binding domain-containing protein [Planococcus salinus]
MLKAKVTSKGQITIPIEIRKLLKANSGDAITFEVKEEGIFIKKENQPKTIQERFADYHLENNKEKIQAAMKDPDFGLPLGEEIW